MVLAAGQTGHLTDHEEALYTVDHGSTAATARPTLGSGGTAPSQVLWRGTVEPDNWIDGDRYIHKTDGTEYIRVSGVAVLIGNAAYQPLGGHFYPASYAGDIAAAAAAAKAADGTLVLPVADYDINTTTLVIECAVDAKQGARILYSGTGTAVKLGATGTTLKNREVKLPQIIQDGTAGTGLGLKYVDCDASRIFVPNIYNFADGLDYGGTGAGVAYNTTVIGDIQVKNRPIVALPTAGGWGNQNVFLGGRLRTTQSGTAVAGTRAFQIGSSTIPGQNGNVFVGVSAEGDEWEYHVECYGDDNEWFNCRWETSVATNPKFFFGDQGDASDFAANNVIRGGFDLEDAEITEQTLSNRNLIIHPRLEIGGRGTSAGAIISKNPSGANPWLVLYSATGNLSTAADWMTKYGATRAFQAKADTDTDARMYVDSALGRLYMGLGSAAATFFLRAIAQNGLQINGAHLRFSPADTYDVGANGERPRDVIAGRLTTCGKGATGSRPTPVSGVVSMWFDATLGKPIWHNGTNWVDATGATV